MFATLHTPLPTLKNPLKFYSNHLHDDLKLTLLHALKNAKSSITLYIYGLSDPEIIALLQQKKNEGLSVEIFYDKKGSKHLPSSLEAIPVKTKGLMHRKILIIDQQLIFLGSANFTTHSLKFHDNLIIGLFNPPLAHFLAKGTSIPASSIECFLLPDVEKKALSYLISLLANAEKKIQIAMFTFTHPDLIETLETAIKRGIEVELAIDRYTALGASKKGVKKLIDAGAKVCQHRGDQLLHHKWVLIDGAILVTGSANWTRAAFEKNQDCLLVLKDLNKREQKILNRMFYMN